MASHRSWFRSVLHEIAAFAAVPGVPAPSPLLPDPNDARFVVAEIAVSTGSYIIASHDGGKTFDAPHLYDTPDLLTGIEIARSKAGVVYATSVPSNSGGTAKFLASTNSGAVGTWTATELRIPPGTQPRILAVDPLDEKK